MFKFIVIMGCLLWIFSVMAAMFSHFAQVSGPSHQLRHQRPGGYKGFEGYTQGCQSRKNLTEIPGIQTNNYPYRGFMVLPSLKLTEFTPENGWLEDDPFLLGWCNLAWANC